MDDGMMVPYLHFSGGDFLFFKFLQPSSAGALAVASIALFLIALIERGLAALRASLEAYWSRSVLKLSSLDDTLSDDGSDHDRISIRSLLYASRNGKAPPKDPRRAIPAFIPLHDILRGLLYSLQTLLTYTLMLAAMTFQAAYIISIIVGLGVGEMIFGRFRAVEGHPSH